jgi:deoxyadenosine/deoxycytidine kinase
MPYYSSQFVTCPQCAGAGKISPSDKHGAGGNLVCNECGGIGLGTFIKNDFLYWGYDLTPAKIIVRQSQLIFDYVINIIFLVLGAGGIISLCLWIGQNALAQNNKIYLGVLISFWGVKNSLIFYFWLGLGFLSFYSYRRARQKEKHPAVKILTYWQKEWVKKQPQIIPNNWKELKFYKTKLDVSRSYRYDLLKLIEKAYALAIQMRHQELLPAHLILVVISEYGEQNKNIEVKRVSEIFSRLGIHRGKIGPKLEQALRKGATVVGNAPVNPKLSLEIKRAFIEAYVRARENKHSYIEITDLISPLINESIILKGELAGLGVKPEQVENSIQWILISDQYAARENYWRLHQSISLRQKMEMATAATATPILDHFCVDLTQAKLAEPALVFIGREMETEEIFKALAAKKKKIVIVGERGAGKGALVDYLAEQIAADEVPSTLKGKRLIELDLNKIKNEASGFDFAQKISIILHELNKSNSILTIKDITDELWALIDKYAGNAYIIATANKKLINAHNIELSEPKKDTLILILASIAAQLEREFKINFNYESLEVIASAAKNYPAGEFLPARAIHLLKKIAQSYAGAPNRAIDTGAAAKVIATEVGTPYTKILKEMNS